MKHAAFYNAQIVDSNAFFGCTALEEVYLPEALSIGGNAFTNCASLKTIKLNKVSSIGVSAFEKCANLHFSIPDSVTSIGMRGLLGIANKVLYVPMGVNAEITSFSTDVKLLASSDARIATDEAFVDRKVEIYEGPRVRTESFGDMLELSVMENWVPTTLLYEIQSMELPYAEEYRYCFSTELYKYGTEIENEWYTLFTPDIGYPSLMMEYFGDVNTYLYIALINGETVTYLRSNAFIPYNTSPYQYTVETSDEYPYGAITITSWKPEADENEIMVPCYIDGLPVVAIAEGAFTNIHAESICFDDSNLDVICSGAFKNCETSKYVFGNVDEIQKGAFLNCGMTNFYANDIGTIRSGAFTGCANLCELHANGEIREIEANAFAEDNKLAFYPLSVNDIQYGHTDMGIGIIGLAEGFDKNITNIRIPRIVDDYEVTEIAREAFANNSNLRRVALPDTIWTIGERAFANCASLETVYISPMGYGEVTIREGAFMNCTNLKVSIPDNVTIIDKDAFAGVPGNGVYIPIYTSLDSQAFNSGTTIQTVTGSYAAFDFAAVSGSPYQVQVLGEAPVRLITDVCGHYYQYTPGDSLKPDDARVVHFFVTGVPYGGSVEMALWQLQTGTFAITEEMLENTEWDEICADEEYRQLFCNIRGALVFRITDLYGNVSYLASSVYSEW